MNILHVITDLSLGGAESALVRLALATRAAGHRVDVVALKRLGPAAAPLLEAGVPCTALGAPLQPGLGLAAVVMRLGAFVRQRSFDVVHAWLATGCAAVHLAVPSSIPRVYAIRVTDVPPAAVCVLLSAPAGGRARWVAVSRAAAETWQRALRISDVTVIPNGIDAGPPPSDEPAGARPVFVGRLAAQKGVDVLLRALTTTGLHVDIYGEGDARAELESLSHELGVDGRAHFHGRTDVPRKVMREASMLVLPSRSEGLPNAVLEAMAEARAVVATRIPGTDEAVLDGHTGTLVPPEDPEPLANAMERLAGDPALRCRFGRAGRARVEQTFTHASVVERTLRVYDELA